MSPVTRRTLDRDSGWPPEPDTSSSQLGPWSDTACVCWAASTPARAMGRRCAGDDAGMQLDAHRAGQRAAARVPAAEDALRRAFSPGSATGGTGGSCARIHSSAWPRRTRPRSRRLRRASETVGRRAPTRRPSCSWVSGKRQHDAVGRDAATAVGEVPEQPVQAVLDARQVAERERDARSAGRARARGRRAPSRAPGTRAMRCAKAWSRTSRRAGSRISHCGSRPSRRSSVAVVRAEQVALGEQFGAEGLGALEVAHQQAAQDEQAEAAADALGRDGGVPASARERDGAGDRGGAGLGGVRAQPAREIAVGVEQAHGLHRTGRSVEAPVRPLRLCSLVHERHRGTCFPLFRCT